MGGTDLLPSIQNAHLSPRSHPPVPPPPVVTPPQGWILVAVATGEWERNMDGWEQDRQNEVVCSVLFHSLELFTAAGNTKLCRASVLIYMLIHLYPLD